MPLASCVCVFRDVLIYDSTFALNRVRMLQSVILVILFHKLFAVFQVSVELIVVPILLILRRRIFKGYGFRIFLFRGVPAEINVSRHLSIFYVFFLGRKQTK